MPTTTPVSQSLILTGISTRSTRLRRRGLADLGLAHDDTESAIGLFQTRRFGQHSATSGNRQRRSISSLWKPLRPSRPVLQLGEQTAIPNGRLVRPAHSHGFLATTVCQCPLPIWKRGAAAMGCIATGRTRTETAKRPVSFFSASQKSVSLLALAGTV